MDTDDLIASQIAYYRARAAEYDNWLEDRDESDISAEFLERWEADDVAARAWLAADPPRGHVLEIAAGSGSWTGELLRTADRVTAVDAAPEMLALLSRKHDGVETITADVFAWEPAQRYDDIFFGFWLTHVPAARWEGFWDLVGRALVPGGRVFFVDNAHPDFANASGPGDWPEAVGERRSETAGPETRRRTLRDGSQWTMVKRFWRPGELTAELARLGWLASAAHTSFAFIYGTARRLVAEPAEIP